MAAIIGFPECIEVDSILSSSEFKSWQKTQKYIQFLTVSKL